MELSFASQRALKSSALEYSESVIKATDEHLKSLLHRYDKGEITYEEAMDEILEQAKKA